MSRAGRIADQESVIYKMVFQGKEHLARSNGMPVARAFANHEQEPYAFRGCPKLGRGTSILMQRRVGAQDPP